jgi:hypothetical protein
MNIDEAWLSDSLLTVLSREQMDDESRAGVRRARYVPGCPSKCYRGMATVLSIVVDGMRQGLSVDQVIDEVDQGLKD